MTAAATKRTFGSGVWQAGGDGGDEHGEQKVASHWRTAATKRLRRKRQKTCSASTASRRWRPAAGHYGERRAGGRPVEEEDSKESVGPCESNTVSKRKISSEYEINKWSARILTR
ncbi:hypothetical protein SEVIR_4G079201v4 [Setaria viridis]|uniref:Uncharacterized protein n=1 Tax=Setaria viridis TaxID=4556 RepID=A0A4U6UY89_SETVI|nr:hypothetical protein SEVIR_4G079201v2 [Setaria viridis]